MNNMENNCTCHNKQEIPIPSSMWQDLKTRWKAESPKFWKKIMNITIAVGSSATAVVGSDQLFGLQAYGVPQIVFTIAGYIIVACAAVGLSAKITKQ